MPIIHSLNATSNTFILTQSGNINFTKDSEQGISLLEAITCTYPYNCISTPE